MAQIFRISGYLVDPSDDCNKEEIEVSITDRLDMFCQQLHIESADIGE